MIISQNIVEPNQIFLSFCIWSKEKKKSIILLDTHQKAAITMI